MCIPSNPLYIPMFISTLYIVFFCFQLYIITLCLLPLKLLKKNGVSVIRSLYYFMSLYITSASDMTSKKSICQFMSQYVSAVHLTKLLIMCGGPSLKHMYTFIPVETVKCLLMHSIIRLDIILKNLMSVGLSHYVFKGK